MRQFNREIDAPFSFKKATKYEPRHEYMTKMAAQALIAGFLAYVATLLICLGFGLRVRGAAVVAGFAIILIFVINYIMQWREELLWGIEEIIGHDLDNDGFAGKPPQLTVEVQHNERQTTFAGLPGPPNAIIAWSRAAVSGHSLAYENWQPLFGEYTTPMGRKVDLYREFRRACTARGLLVEQGTHSCSLTEPGKQFFAELSTKTIDDLTPLLEA